MDDLCLRSARKLPQSFSTITDGDDPDGTNVLRQAQNVLHFLIIERPNKAGAQALVHYCEQDEHRGEAAIDDAEKVDASLSVPLRRPSGIRDDDDDQRSLGDAHLLERGLRQSLFHLLVMHYDEFL